MLDIKRIQRFLSEKGFYSGKIDGDYGGATRKAVRDFQRNIGFVGMDIDGVVGAKTLQKMKEQGYSDIEFPPKPKDLSVLSPAQRGRIFGVFKHEYANDPTDKDRVSIKGDWVEKNIVTVFIPQLKGVKMWGDLVCDGNIRLHRLAVKNFVGFFDEVEKQGLKHLILTYGGSFYPRYIRGRFGSLSNHSWGTAIDLNVEWNRLNATPAFESEQGSLRELVPIANKWGIYWGGHFDRLDGMHFEVSKLIV